MLVFSRAPHCVRSSPGLHLPLLWLLQVQWQVIMVLPVRRQRQCVRIWDLSSPLLFVKHLWRLEHDEARHQRHACLHPRHLCCTFWDPVYLRR